MNHFKYSLVCIAILLTGCSSLKPAPDPITVNKYVAMPGELIVKCDIFAPPPISTYANSSWQDKEELLISYSVAQTSNLIKCSSTVEAIRNWQAKQKAIYEK